MVEEILNLPLGEKLALQVRGAGWEEGQVDGCVRPLVGCYLSLYPFFRMVGGHVGRDVTWAALANVRRDIQMYNGQIKTVRPVKWLLVEQWITFHHLIRYMFKSNFFGQFYCEHVFFFIFFFINQMITVS